jgi:hypothetical protein
MPIIRQWLDLWSYPTGDIEGSVGFALVLVGMTVCDALLLVATLARRAADLPAAGAEAALNQVAGVPSSPRQSPSRRNRPVAHLGRSSLDWPGLAHAGPGLFLVMVSVNRPSLPVGAQMPFQSIIDATELARAHGALDAAWSEICARQFVLPGTEDAERERLSYNIANFVYVAEDDSDLVRRAVAHFARTAESEP